MDKWEYKTDIYVVSHVNSDAETFPVRSLDGYGEEGWELVSVCAVPHDGKPALMSVPARATAIQVYLKRRVQ